jgi:protein phosphatase
MSDTHPPTSLPPLDSIVDHAEIIDRFCSGFEAILTLSFTDATSMGRSIPFPFFADTDISDLCFFAAAHFRSQPIVLRIDSEVIIVGDLHGSIHDLARILLEHGFTKNYLFLGDYVDRGQFSLECILLLFTLAIRYPGQFNLLRGNHEIRSVARVHGFRGEILQSYPESIFDAFCDAFSYLPLAAIVQGCFFCVHGGIGPDVRSVQEIERLERPIVDDSTRPIVNQLLWADPSSTCQGFCETSKRGTGGVYGAAAVRNFLDENGLEIILRAHECVDGVKRMNNMPVATVFSASHYDTDTPNRSGVIVVDDSKEWKRFKYPPLPKLMRRDALFFKLERTNPFGSRRSIPVKVPLAPSQRRGIAANQGFYGRRSSAAQSLYSFVRPAFRASSTEFRPLLLVPPGAGMTSERDG